MLQDALFAPFWLSAIIDSAEDAIISKDLNGVITSWNRSAERIFGHPAAEVIGKHISIIIPADRQHEETTIIEKVRRGERIEHFETVRIKKDGTPINISLTVSPIKGAEDTIIGVSKIARDITQSKRAETARAEAEERYRALIEATATTVWHADSNGALTFVGNSWTNVTGQNSEDILNWGWLDAIHPDDREQTVEKWQVALQDKSLYKTEFRILTNTQEYKWFEASAVPILNSDGTVREWIGTNIDVHQNRQAEEERRRAAEALRETQETLTIAMQSSRMGAWSRDFLNGEVYWSSEMEALVGLPPGAFCGRIDGFYDHVYQEDKQRISDVIKSALADHKSYSIEFRFHHADGSLRWMEGRGKAIYDADGLPIKAYGIGIDITDRKDAENERVHLLEQLEAERTQLSYIFEQAPAFVAILRGKDHVFELINPAYQQLVGHRNLIGLPIREALPEMEEQGFFNLLDNVIQTGNAFTGRELPVNIQRIPGGALEKAFVNLVYQPITGIDNTISGVFVHGIDITEQVTARKEAEAANRLKDEFLATVSHELRTPLNAILGWSQIGQQIGKQPADADLEKSQIALAKIERNAKAQNQLIEDLLDVSRIITGKLHLNTVKVDLQNIVLAALDTIKPAAEAKNIKVKTILDPNVGLMLGDRERLQQIVWNLLSNAVKFTPKGGRVEVQLERIDSQVEIVVSDTGKGIEAEFLPFVFDRFRQADQTITRTFGGLGLGLAIVRQLVELHGGHVSVSSGGADQGASFTVSFPLAADNNEKQLNQKLNSAAVNVEDNNSTDRDFNLENLNVIIVDDEPDSLELTKVILAQCGAQVVSTQSAAEAFNKFNEFDFDLLISDIGMPGEDGYSLIEKIRSLPEAHGGKIPAIALTAYARAEDRARTLRSGFQTYIPKPVDASELLMVIANLSGRID